MKSIKPIIQAITYRLYYYCCPDKIYLNNKFKQVFGRDIDWKNPTTFNEKLQWLKIYDRNPLYTQLVDKYEVRKYIAEKIGEEYLIPCLGVWNKFDDIDFDKLPNQFVLKCTHDSHSVIICEDKSTFDFEMARKSLAEHLKRNFYYNAREWPYKNVKPRIIAEQYMTENNVTKREPLTDYKFFCFEGEPRFMYISKDIGVNPTTDFFDMEFNNLPFKMKDPNSATKPMKPEQFDTMKKLARILSKGLPHVRVDFYCINGHLYVGELTFYHSSGFSPVNPVEWDEKIGNYIKLP